MAGARALLPPRSSGPDFFVLLSFTARTAISAPSKLPNADYLNVRFIRHPYKIHTDLICAASTSQ
jgi:hypothetical protein